MDWPATRNRRADPLLFLLIVVAVAGPLLLGMFGSDIALGPTRTAFWAVLTAVHAAFAVFAHRVARLHVSGDPRIRATRRLWRLFAAAGVIWAAGDAHLLAEAFADPHGRRASVDLAVHLVSLMAGLLLLLIGLLRFPGGNRAGLRMDVATVMISAATASLLVLQLPPGETDAQWTLNLLAALSIQPGIFLVVVFAVVRLFLGGRSPFTRTTGTIYGLAAISQMVLQVLPPEAYAGSRAGSWVAAAFVLCGSVLALGARAQEGHVRTVAAGDTERPVRSHSWLPYGAMAVTWLISSGMLVAYGLTWRTWLVLAGTGVTTMLVVARQVAAFRRVEQLLAERDALAARLTELAFHDGLTGLANRALFRRTLTDYLSRSPVTVFLLDLDDFKPVNDNFGHATGDRLLIEVGLRLRDCLRPGDMVARLGGDEFAVLVDGLDPDRQEAMAAELTAALTGQVPLGDVHVMLRASVGAATGHPGTHDPDSLMHEADMAMYAVKNAARIVRH